MKNPTGLALKRCTMVFAVLALSLPARAADQSARFREAATLHRAGDTVAAMAIWLPLAGSGDVNAAYNLAVVHQYGDGVPKNAAEALKWYRVAAERGDRPAQSRLGAMYLNGEGTPRDEKEGWRWINAHRLAHAHHDHHPQMLAWRKQAASLIWASDMRESIAASRAGSAQVLAELKRCATAAAAGSAAVMAKID